MIGGVMKRISIALLFLAFPACESTNLLKESIALQKQMLATTTGMRADMQAFQQQMAGLVPDIAKAAKQVGDDLLNQVFQKGLVLYMQARQDLNTDAKSLLAAAGPQFLSGLASMPLADQARVAAAFNKFLDQTAVGGIKQEIATLNSGISGITGTVQSALGKVDKIANSGIEAGGAIKNELGKLNSNLAGLKEGINAGLQKVDNLAKNAGLSLGKGIHSTELAVIPSELPPVKGFKQK